MSEKTIFARIIDRELPATIVFEDDRCLAFEDINPGAPTHILVIPKKPIDRLSNASEQDEALIGHLFRVATQVGKDAGLEDFRLVVNDGAGAGQTVFHLHVHVIGGRELSWPPG